MDDLEKLAVDGAKSLVDALGSGVEKTLSQWLATVLRGHEHRAEGARQRLIQARNDETLEEVRAGEITAWAQRLRDLLEDSPDVAKDLRRLISSDVSIEDVDQRVRQQANPTRGASSVQIAAGASNTIDVGRTDNRKYTFSIPLIGGIWQAIVAHPVVATVICVVVVGGGAGAGVSLWQGNSPRVSTFTMPAGRQVDLSSTPPKLVGLGPDSDASYMPNPLWGESFVLTSRNFAAFTGQGAPSEATCKNLVNTDSLQGAKAAPGLVYCFTTHVSSVGYLQVIDVTPQQAVVKVVLFPRS